MRFSQPQFLHRALLLFFLVAFGAHGVAAQSEDYLATRWQNGLTEPWFMDSERYNKEEAATAQARWKAIGDDLKNPADDEWAGDYFVGGDTHGSYLRWSVKSGFVLAHVDKCAARVMDFSYGKVVVTSTLITFVPERRPKASASHNADSHSMTTDFVPAKWRGAHYLVGENEMKDFGDYVAGLGKFNIGSNPLLWVEGSPFFYKLGDEETERAGEAPVVPAGFERFIKKPIEARVVAVGPRRLKRSALIDGSTYYESRTTVYLDAGLAAGVRRGMSFKVLGSAAGDTVVIVRAGRNTSLGSIVRKVNQENKSDIYFDWIENKQQVRAAPVISVGWRVTTESI